MTRTRLKLIALFVLCGCTSENAPLKTEAEQTEAVQTEAGRIEAGRIDDDSIITPLTATAGNADRGRAVFSARESGHCVLCHQVSGLDVPFQGDVGPDLSTVGERLTAGQLRLRIADYDAFRPGTVMPSYYRTQNLRQVGAAYQGQTVLSAQDIEDVIAYLSTLNDQSVE